MDKATMQAKRSMAFNNLCRDQMATMFTQGVYTRDMERMAVLATLLKRNFNWSIKDAANS